MREDMSKITSLHANHNTSLEAFSYIRNQLNKKPAFILFFSSTKYDFAQLTALFHEEYKDSEIVGVSTTGEIHTKGFANNSLSVMAFYEGTCKAKAVLMDDIAKHPIFSRKKLIEAANSIGINRNGKPARGSELALVFPNGLVMGEEKMLSVVNSIFTYDEFPVVGGTAGDDGKFEQTFVSCNGVVSSQGGAVVFLKTDLHIVIQKENIFSSTGKKMKITKADMEKRIIHEMNGRTASSEYARLLGVSPANLSNYFMKNPIGRRIHNDIWIASPFQVMSDGSIQFYCQVFQDETVELLQVESAVDKLQESIHKLEEEMVQIEGVLAMNCILRKLQFELEGSIPLLNTHLSKVPNLSGFSSYGEQLGKQQLNQTLVMLAFGKRRG